MALARQGLLKLLGLRRSGILNENYRTASAAHRKNIFVLRANTLSNKPFRRLALLPALFFLAQGIHYWQINQLGHMLWMCNIGNLLLAAGIFFEKPLLIRVAVIWSLPGAIVWCVYVVPTWGLVLTGRGNAADVYAAIASTFAHVGGLSVAILALKRVKMKNGTWLYALGWYFIIQAASRVFTSDELNVNLSHHLAYGWETRFGSYWTFWCLLALLTALVLWCLELALRLLWPLPE
ncbi:MAG TPA: hypothetical protein VJT50_17245 [Pyrinomonadaceae bacterium]|nr:hypothetical protein [Pyrinomonadaceae bacterium]